MNRRALGWGLGLAAAAAVAGASLAMGAQVGTPPEGAAAAPAAPTNTVKITIVTVPQAKKVMVLWGKKRLGIIAPRQPLILQRPRDSGPMDLLIQSEGYVTVQTRAYTFADTKLSVKLTPIDQKKTLLGYREEVPPPDAGAPPAMGAPLPGAAPPTAAVPGAPGPDAGVR
jgi:hypothetical protein